MNFHRARVREKQHRGFMVSLFAAAHARRVQVRDDEYAEYRRQRDILEERFGFSRVDRCLEKPIKQYIEQHQQELYDERARLDQSHFHGCFTCAHACVDANTEDLDAWCQKFKDGPPNALVKCPFYTPPRDP